MNSFFLKKGTWYKHLIKTKTINNPLQVLSNLTFDLIEFWIENYANSRVVFRNILSSALLTVIHFSFSFEFPTYILWFEKGGFLIRKIYTDGQHTSCGWQVFFFLNKRHWTYIEKTNGINVFVMRLAQFLIYGHLPPRTHCTIRVCRLSPKSHYNEINMRPLPPSAASESHGHFMRNARENNIEKIVERFV